MNKKNPTPFENKMNAAVVGLASLFLGGYGMAMNNLARESSSSDLRVIAGVCFAGAVLGALGAINSLVPLSHSSKMEPK